MIQATTPRKLFIWLLFLLLTGCQTTSPAKKVIHFQPPKVLAQLPPLRDVTLVKINNDWNGYSDITPIVRHSQLKPQASGMSGNGYFAVGGYGGYSIHQQYTKKINIPVLITQQFFKKINETKIYSSSLYQPIIKNSDDYPAITIQISTPEQKVTFFSSSQGKNHTPWQIKVKEKTYTSDSTAPGEALLILKPYIDHPGLEEAINKLRSPRPQTPKNSKVHKNKFS